MKVCGVCDNYAILISVFSEKYVAMSLTLNSVLSPRSKCFITKASILLYIQFKTLFKVDGRHMYDHESWSMTIYVFLMWFNFVYNRTWPAGGSGGVTDGAGLWHGRPCVFQMTISTSFTTDILRNCFTTYWHKIAVWRCMYSFGAWERDAVFTSLGVTPEVWMSFPSTHACWEQTV